MFIRLLGKRRKLPQLSSGSARPENEIFVFYQLERTQAYLMIRNVLFRPISFY